MGDIPYIEKYKKLCKLAAEDDATFASFKCHPDYTPMLEHVTFEQGIQYLDVIRGRTQPALLPLEKFCRNDSIGSPHVYNFFGAGVFSPTTLRYIKTLSDMIEMFETLDNLSIIELGGGYGGQCKVISGAFKFKSYIIVDLPEVVGLINRYLAATAVPNTRAITLNELTDTTYDLFISNYAFTELPRDLQEVYINRVLNNSEHGYITCNEISKDCEIDSMPREEFLRKIKHEHVILDEFPKTHAKNFLLVW